MEIGKQIKKHRTEFGFSQDILAEKVYVSRQTISNWETGKSYPDVKSLLLLSSLFDVTLDTLIKGDLEEMKDKVTLEDKTQFEHDSTIFTTLLIGTIILPVPLTHFLGYVGFAIFAVLAVSTMYYGIRIEKQKKNLDIQTYKEILAFTEGNNLSTNERNQELGKRPYQKLLLPLVAALITLIIGIVLALVLR